MKTINLILKGDTTPKKVTPDKLEELFHITYLPTLAFAHWEVEAFLQKKCKKALKKGNIGQLALWLGKLHAKEIEEQNIPPLTIKWVCDKKGYGVFADKEFAPWEMVGEYTGVVRRRKRIFPDVNDYCFMYPKEWLSLKAFTIDSEKEGNFTRFINHSDYPNCESVAIFYKGTMHIVFRTIKAIAPGEELTYDYGDIYWEKRDKLIEVKV